VPACTTPLPLRLLPPGALDLPRLHLPQEWVGHLRLPHHQGWADRLRLLRRQEWADHLLRLPLEGAPRPHLLLGGLHDPLVPLDLRPHLK